MENITNMKLPECSICFLPFSVNGYLGKSVRIPLLLHCAHPACENCIISNLRMKNFITCSTCRKVSTLLSTSNECDILSQFPIDNNLCGLYYNKANSISIEGDTQIGFIKPVLKKKDISRNMLCNECQDVRADQLCKQCSAPYCAPCFKKVHNSARALRDHGFTPLTDNIQTFGTNDFEETICKEHVSHNLEFFCDQCDVTICSRCLLASHNGHKIQILLEKNKECRNEVIESIVRVSNIQRRLKASKKETNQMLCLSKKKDSSSVEIQVRDHFLRVHGLLTLLQNKITNQIKTAQSTSTLTEIIAQLNSYIEETDSSLDLGKRLLSDDLMSSVNYKNILSLLQSKEQIPCYVLKENVGDNIIFEADEAIDEQIENHCSLTIKEKSQYRLVNENDLPDEYSFIEKIQEVSVDDIEAALELSNEKKLDKSSLSLVRKSECDSSVNSSVLTLNKKESSDNSSCASISSVNSSCYDIPMAYSSTMHDELVPGCSVQVTISHLISPSDFYVHRIGFFKKMEELQMYFRKSIVGRHGNRKQKIAKGSIYALFIENEQHWYRARVMELINENQVKILFVDYGHTDIINKDRLKTVPKNILNIPPYALRCKLANCQPINGNSWDVQGITIMAQITSFQNNSHRGPNEILAITVLEKTPLFYEVEMFRQSDTYIFNVAETLTFLSLASTSNIPKDFPHTTFGSSTRTMKTMPARQVLKQGSILDAKMGFIMDPDHFYIIVKQGFRITKKIIDLQDELQRVYNGKMQNTSAMYNPKPGVFVAARCSIDKKWYRAEVITIPDAKMVKVFYIDFGKSEVLNWKSIKILFSKFYKLPPQAYRCRLSDIEPLGTDNWQVNAAHILKNETQEIPLKAMIEKVNDDAISVVLYKSMKDADICINALLVRHQLAISTGISSTVVEFPKLYELPKNDNTFQCDIEVENQSKNTKKLTKTQTEQDLSNFFIKSPNGCVKIQVNVKRIIDPGEFYITLCYVDEGEKLILDNNLQEYYGTSELSKESLVWQVDNRCAVMINEKWFRAIIEEVISEKEYKVYVPDEGLTEIVNAENMRILAYQFADQRDWVNKCYLGGLLPTPNFWAKTSITEFEEFVKTNRGNLYITKMTQSEIKSNALAVELFKRTIIPAGPLEAAKDKWTSFNHYLRMIGLAKADSVTKWDVDGNIINENNEGDTAESEAKMLQDILSSSFKRMSKSASPEPYGTDNNFVAVKWLPPDPVTSLEFIGTPTYIDDDCNIYIQDFLRSTLTLPQISEDLTNRFKNTLPTKYDLSWTPGDICGAEYFVDKKWYRGLVKKVINENSALVQFVDYGNVDPCEIESLRKKPSMTHIPVQATGFRLHTITSVNLDNKWRREELDIIHTSVATKNCRVELEMIPGGYGVKRLIMANGEDAIASWVAKKWARYANESLADYLEREKNESQLTEDTREVEEQEEIEVEEFLDEMEGVDEIFSVNSEEGTISEESPVSDVSGNEVSFLSDNGENDKNEIASSINSLCHWPFIVYKNNHEESIPLCKYELLQLGEDIENVTIEMCAVLSEREILATIKSTDNTDLLEHKHYYNFISEIMQQEAINQPLLEKPYKYKMCTAQFTGDDKWYRAVVIEEKENEQLVIQYIDYGNVEIQSAAKVHTIDEEWIKPKAQSLLFSLDVTLVDNRLPKKDIMNKLFACLSRGPLEAKILGRNKLLLTNLLADSIMGYRAKLYFEDKIAYQSFIDEGIFDETLL